MKWKIKILTHKLCKWYIGNEYTITMSLAMALMMGGIYAAIGAL